VALLGRSIVFGRTTESGKRSVDFQAVTGPSRVDERFASRVGSGIHQCPAQEPTAILAMSVGHLALEQLAAASAKVAPRRDDAGAWRAPAALAQFLRTRRFGIFWQPLLMGGFNKARTLT
jgi:hypothetical protein